MPQRTWAVAMTQALYGAGGFYRSPEGPAGHFRTAAHAGAAFAAPLRRLAAEVDAALGFPAPFDLIDLGAGRGELLRVLAAERIPDRWRLMGVDVADRPSDLPAAVEWAVALPGTVAGLVVANEWLDTIPLDIAVLTADGPRLVCVNEHDDPTLGPAPTAEQQKWIDRWWPLTTVGEVAEIGLTRDAAWAGVVRALDRGVAVATDYAHIRDQRPAGGTMTSYQHGRVVAPRLDGCRDVTAHVALDACTAAGCNAGATASAVLTQRDALRQLGVSGRRTSRRADTSPTDYLAALARTAVEADLIDPNGFGGFAWLVQTKGMALPRSFQAAA